MTITVAQTWTDRVSSFIRANMYGEYYAVHADWFGTTSDAEWTVDASVSIDLTDNFYLSAGVQNLFDTEALKIDKRYLIFYSRMLTGIISTTSGIKTLVTNHHRFAFFLYLNIFYNFLYFRFNYN